MAEFLETKGLGLEIKNIINNSKKFLILASPFVNISEQYKTCISNASKQGVEIRFLYGKENYKDDKAKARQEESLIFLKSLSNCKLIKIEFLHAKFFINEESAIIASMNLFTFSEMNNFEMGVLLSSRKDKEAYKNTLQEINSYIRHYGDNDTILDPGEKEVRVGFCIRCLTEIDFNKRSPFCTDCYRIADPYNYQYKQHKFCHACGEQYKASFIEPVNPGCKVVKTKKVLESKF